MITKIDEDRQLWCPPLTALIDYDNLHTIDRHHGVRHIMTTLLHALGSQRMPANRKMDCRLYGGWFEKTSLSPRAYKLLPELRQEFPRSITVSDRDGTQTVLVRTELALALACDPRLDLTHTYRRRSIPPRLRCIATPFSDCWQPSNCPIASLKSFIDNDICPIVRCDVTPQSVLERAEQKLVDSMIIIDLVHLALATSDSLVVVSADDDMWPGIRFALLLGTHVVHVVPRRSWSGSDRYRRLETATYERVVL